MAGNEAFVVRLSDPFYHGATFAGLIETLAALPNVVAVGLPVATLGASGYCIIHERIVAVVTASQSVKHGGLGLARTGDLMECGAALTALQNTVKAG